MSIINTVQRLSLENLIVGNNFLSKKTSEFRDTAIFKGLLYVLGQVEFKNGLRVTGDVIVNGGVIANNIGSSIQLITSQDVVKGDFVAINSDGELKKGFDTDPWIVIPLTGDVVPLADGPYGQIGDKLYLLGGSLVNFGTTTNIVYEICLSTNTMTALTTSGDDPGAWVFNPYSVADPANMDVYRYGGWSGSGAIFSSELHKFHAPTRTWTLIPAGNNPGPRTGGDMVINGGYLYLFGGFEATSFTYNNDMYRLNIANPVDWEIVTTNTPPQGRSDYIWLGYKDRSVLWGGAISGSSSVNDLWEFDFVSMLWTRFQSSNDRFPQPTRSVGAKGVIVDGYMYMYGGSSTSQVYDEFWVLDIERHAWKQIDVAGIHPLSRNYIGLIDNGGLNDVVFFGGFKSINSNNSSTMFRFNRPRKPIGVVESDQTAGSATTVITAGVAENESWVLSTGLPVFVEDAGTLTQVPSQPYTYAVGTAVTETSILLNF